MRKGGTIMIWEGLIISTSRYIEKSKFKMLCYDKYAKSCIRVYFLNIIMHIGL